MRPAHDRLGQRQPAGDGKGIGLAGQAHDQAVGRGQGLDVKLDAGVSHLGSLVGKDLELWIVRGGQRGHTALDQVREQRPGQCSALDRVGARSQLVQEHQRAIVDPLQNVDDVAHMRRKGRERLLDALLVADVGADVLKHGQPRALCHGKVQSALGHQGHEADRLERDGLAAGVGPGDDNDKALFVQVDVDWDDGPRIEQRVARLAQVEHRAGMHEATVSTGAVIARFKGHDLGHRRSSGVRVPGAGQSQVQPGQGLDGEDDRLGVVGHVSR